jgi:hypothetical protein
MRLGATAATAALLLVIAAATTPGTAAENQPVTPSGLVCDPFYTQGCSLVTSADTSTSAVLVAGEYVFVLYPEGLLRRCPLETSNECILFGNLTQPYCQVKNGCGGGTMAILSEGRIIVTSYTDMVRNQLHNATFNVQQSHSYHNHRVLVVV